MAHHLFNFNHKLKRDTMKNLKTLLLGIFFFSSTLMIAQEGHIVKKQNLEIRQENFEKMKAELDLTDEQSEQIKQIYAERNQRLQDDKPSADEFEGMADEEKKAHRMEQMKLRKQVNIETREQIKAVLSDEQIERFEKMKEERFNESEMQHRPRKMHKSDEEHQHQHKKGIKHEH